MELPYAARVQDVRRQRCAIGSIPIARNPAGISRRGALDQMKIEEICNAQLA